MPAERWGECETEELAGADGVVVEEFVEVADAEEEEALGVPLLEEHVLRMAGVSCGSDAGLPGADVGAAGVGGPGGMGGCKHNGEGASGRRQNSEFRIMKGGGDQGWRGWFVCQDCDVCDLCDLRGF